MKKNYRLCYRISEILNIRGILFLATMIHVLAGI